MKTIKQKIKNQFVIMFTVILLVLSMCLSSLNLPQTKKVFASESLTMDSSNVVEDLKGAVINGAEFDIKNYSFNVAKNTEVFLFAEYCYSFYPNLQGNYSLYVYVHNPQGLDFDVNSGRNALEMSIGDKTDYVKYPLEFLNKSVEENKIGLFYKFKVELTEEQKTEILERFDDTERYYHIAGIELLEKGKENPKDWAVNEEYKYSGYSAGYGPSSMGNVSTLEYSKSAGTVALITKEYIGQTYYRPDGTNGTNNYTYDTLQTVYFSVPTEIVTEHGDLTSVRAEWLKTLTQWGLVTGGDDKYYDFFKQLVGVDIQASDMEDKYKEFGVKTLEINDRTYEFNSGLDADTSLNYLAYLFYAGNGVDSADSYKVSSSELLKWMQDYHDDYDNYTERIVEVEGESVQEGLTPIYTYKYKTPYGGEYLTVDGVTYAYSKALFQWWNKEKTIADISAKEQKSLTEIKIGQTWWESLWGDYHETSNKTFDGIEAIKQVSEDDFKATIHETCENLYINEGDYEEFKNFYDDSVKENRTVYLLRFDVGNYYVQEAGQGVPDTDGIVTGLDGDTNAYLFSTSAYLGFDLIQLEYGAGEEIFVLPVVSDPFDIVSGTTPPQFTHSDAGIRWWIILLVILAVIILIIAIDLLWFRRNTVEVYQGENSKKPKQEKITVDNADMLKDISEKISRTEKYAKQSAESARKIQKEVKANACQKSSGDKSRGSKGSNKKSSAVAKANYASKTNVQKGGKTQGKNSNAKGGKTNGKAKSPKVKGAKVQSGSASVSYKKLRGGSYTKR